MFVLVAARIARNDYRMNTPLQNRGSPETNRSRKIAFLIYPDCEILDLCGPFDAFYYAHRGLLRLGRTEEPDYQCVILAAAPGPVRTKCGIEVIANCGYREIDSGFDTLIVAGGEGCEQVSRDADLVGWVKSMAPRVRRLASICTGAFILAAAGLLDHRRVTTHWMYSELLAATYPSIQLEPNLICARDGNIYTTGGITAGIDLALALVEEDLGQEIALLVSRMMVVFPRRPGGQSQFSGYFNPDTRIRRDIGELQAWILGHPAADLGVPALADRLAMSPRNFSRLFRSETGQTPANFVERARADAARCKLEQTLLPIEAIAAECGFENPERMRRTFQRLFDTNPADYRSRFRFGLLADRA